MLTEEQRLIRDTARDFAREQLAPYAAERDREAKAPIEVLRAMGKLGLMGMTVAPEWGGAGADFLSYVLAMEEIAGGDGGISTIMSAGTNTSSSTIWQVSEVRWPSFFSIAATFQPSLSVGTRKQLMPRLPAAGSLAAKTMAISAIEPEVMNCFTPESRQPLPSRRARVFRFEASDPACGSVSAKAPIASPRATFVSHFRFCSSLP